MEETTLDDFLRKVSDDRLKREIKNLCMSYSHPWDLLAELCQNSVDAIKRWNDEFPDDERKHKVVVTVDSKARRIEITDTGIGINPEEISDLLAPHGTDKEGVAKQVGEKGVGLTFCMFQSENFTAETAHPNGRKKVRCQHCVSWADGRNSEIPQLETLERSNDPVDPSDTGTTITLEGVLEEYDAESDIFHQNTNTLIHLLRTKTAIGYTDELLRSSPLELKVVLNHIPLDAESFSDEIPFGFHWPHESMKAKDLLDYDEFMKKAPLWDDKQKVKRLKGKCIQRYLEVQRSGSTIPVYAFFAPVRDVWDDLTKSIGITDSVEDARDHPFSVSPGVTIATRGMPTGIVIEHPRTGFSGYWENILVLIEHDRLSFDLGRKSIPGRTKGMLKDIAKDVFNDMIKIFNIVLTEEKKKTTTPRPKPSAIAKASRAAEFKKFAALNNLNLDEISYLKYPDGQEAAVSAIFYELVGSKALKGYHGLRTSYKGQYDLWGRYIINKSNLGENYAQDQNLEDDIDVEVVIEFKHKCSSILRDVDENRKFFEEIDLIVCWELDEQEFSSQQIDVRVLPKEDVFFDGSNYELEWPGAFNLGPSSRKPVLALRKLIEDHVRG